MKSLLTYAIALAVLLVCDFVWLGTTAGTLYRPNMQGLIRDQISLAPALGFYALYAFGLCYLIILPATSAGAVNWLDMSIRAVVLGLVAYGTYDLTGLAVLKGWSLRLSVIDMAWGATASLITTTATVGLLKMMGQLR